jgi:hypothetical protein
VQMLTDLQWENTTLVTRVKELEAQLENAQETNQREYLALQALQQERQDMTQRRSSSVLIGSLADELEDAEAEVAYVDDDGDGDYPLPRDSSSPKSAMSPEPSEERDAAREFFFLSVLCIQHTDGRKLDHLTTAFTQTLWERAKEERVQFYDYTAWINKHVAIEPTTRVTRDKTLALSPVAVTLPPRQIEPL